MKCSHDSVVASALQELQAWLEGEAYRGWDPHDGLNSAFLNAATFRSRHLGMAVLQLLRRLPINMRPVLGVKKGFNPKGVGLFLSAYLKRYAHWRKEEDVEKVEAFARWLEENCSEDYDEYCWGYNFAWPNRAFYIEEGVPTIVNTSFIAHAFLDAYELLGDQKYLDVAVSACRWMLNIGRNEFDNGVCLNYTGSSENEQCTTHNHSMYGAAIFAKTAMMLNERVAIRANIIAFGK